MMDNPFYVAFLEKYGIAPGGENEALLAEQITSLTAGLARFALEGKKK